MLTDPKHTEILDELNGNMTKIIDECVGADTIDEYSVLCHGDCWINNLLFQYNNEICSKVERYFYRN